MSIEDIQKEIIEEFSFFGDWMEKYEYIIDLGKQLPLIDGTYKDEEHLIKGCQSQVWLHAEQLDDKVQFTADSDAVITKGIIALLIRTHDGPTCRRYR
jgi:cysteine desulfuration protein SufE